MNRIIFIISLFMAIIVSNKLFCQDTINLIDGRRISAQNIYEDTSNIFLKYDLLRKGKLSERKIDKVDIFSIDYINKTHKQFYRQDTAFGYYLTVSEMESYVLGSRDALKNYKAPWVTICGTASGFTPTFFYLGFYGLLAPVVYGTTMGAIKPKIKISENIPPAVRNEQYFISGYKDTATRKKIKNALLGSISGVIVAGITSYVIYVAKK